VGRVGLGEVALQPQPLGLQLPCSLVHPLARRE
jgi:hypothetical protein